MMNKYKILKVDLTEIDYFEDFIKRMANEGWHPVKSWVSVFGILKFEYKPDLVRTYSVVYNQIKSQVQFAKREMLSDYQSDREFKDMLDDFDVKLVMTYEGFDILYSNNNISAFTEEEEQDDIRRNVAKKQLRNWAFFGIAYSLFIFAFISRGHKTIIDYLSTVNLFLTITYGMWIIVSINMVYKNDRVDKGHTPRKKDKGNSLDNSNFSAILGVFVIVILLSIIPVFLFSDTYGLAPIMFIEMLVLIFLIAGALIIVDKFKMKKRNRYAFKIIVSILIFLVINSIFFGFYWRNMLSSINDDLSKPTSEIEKRLCRNEVKTYRTHSFFVEEIDISCRSGEDYEERFTLYEIKFPIAKGLFRDLIVDSLGMNSFPKGSAFKFMKHDGRDYYSEMNGLITDNYIIESDDEIPNGLISYLLEMSD